MPLDAGDGLDDATEREDGPDDAAGELAELRSRVEDLEENGDGGNYAGASAGYSVGAALAAILSWHSFHAVLWAALAGFFSWFYVVYYVIVHWANVRLV